MVHIHNVAISIELFGLFAKKIFIYFYFLCFFYKENHQS